MALIEIQHPSNPQYTILINEDNFDPSQHVKVGEQKQNIPTPPPPTPEPEVGGVPIPEEQANAQQDTPQEVQEEVQDLPQEEVAADPSPEVSAREQELRTIYHKSPGGWRAIKSIAEKAGITEVPEGGWEDAIPLIVEAEAAQ